MIQLLRGRCRAHVWVLGILLALCSGRTFFLLSILGFSPSSLFELRMLLLFCWAGFRVHSMHCVSRSARRGGRGLSCSHAWHRPPWHCTPIWSAPGCLHARRESLVLWCPWEHLSFPTSLWTCWCGHHFFKAWVLPLSPWLHILRHCQCCHWSEPQGVQKPGPHAKFGYSFSPPFSFPEILSSHVETCPVELMLERCRKQAI